MSQCIHPNTFGVFVRELAFSRRLLSACTFRWLVSTTQTFHIKERVFGISPQLRLNTVCNMSSAAAAGDVSVATAAPRLVITDLDETINLVALSIPGTCVLCCCIVRAL